VGLHETLHLQYMMWEIFLNIIFTIFENLRKIKMFAKNFRYLFICIAIEL